MQKELAINGINRAIPGSSAPDGSCQEIINARYRKGAWRPIPPKHLIGSSTFLYSGSPIVFDSIYLHDLENGYTAGSPNWIGYRKNGSVGELYQIDPLYSGAPLTFSTWQINNAIDISNGFVPSVSFLKRFMLVTSASGLLIYLWTDTGTYTLIQSLVTPDVELHKDNLILVDWPLFQEGSTAAETLANYWTILNNQSQNTGQLYGSIMYIACYKLFDGSYVMPSIPRYFELSNDGLVVLQNHVGTGGYTSFFKFTMSGLSAGFDTSILPGNISTWQELVSSVCIFATKCTPLHKVDETTFTDTILKTPPTNYPPMAKTTTQSKLYFSQFFPLNTDFQKLPDSSGFYLIHEFDFGNLASTGGIVIEDVDTINYYQNYAANQSLPADSFTHHSLVPKATYVYNDRLHELNIKTLYGSAYVQWPVFRNDYDMGQSGSVAGNISVWLKTSLGQAIVNTPVNIPYFQAATKTIETIGNIAIMTNALTVAQTRAKYLNANPTTNGVANFVPGSAYYYVGNTDGTPVLITGVTNPYNPTSPPQTAYVTYRIKSGSINTFILPSIVGYNDYRATRMVISYFDGTNHYQLLDQKLKQNIGLNFAYYAPLVFSTDNTNTGANFSDQILPTPVTIISLPITAGTDYDSNRVQVSEIQNPLVFPAQYSYQVGTGEGLAMCAGTEPLSMGQFGQFPLQIFTTKGIWALELGSSSILYSNVLPVSGEVADNVKNIISIGSSVIYTTLRGVYMITGRTSQQISEVVEGIPDAFLLKQEIATLITTAKYTPGLNNSLSGEDFLTYLLTSSIGYDQIQKELIISNPAHPYCYVLSFESKLWYKVNRQYTMLINAWPNFYALTSTQILNLSIENDPGSDLTEVLIVTNPQSLEQADAYKKIERAVLRLMATTGASQYSGIYVFGSNDLNTWQILTGKQRTGTLIKDLMIQRAQGTAKYFIFVINGTITTDSEIKHIDIQFIGKWNQKLR